MANETKHSVSSIFSRLRSPRIVLPVFGVLLFIVPLLTQDEYTRHLMVVSLMFGAQAMTSDFTIGFINITNFGFAAFVGLGAYTSALLAADLGLDPFLGMLLGTILSGLVGFLTGLLTLRLRGLFVAIMAWFVAIALKALAAVLVDLTRGYLGLFVPPLFETRSTLLYYYVLLAIVALIFFVTRSIVKGRVGLAFQAIGQDLDYARASGINPVRYKLIAFTLSCAFAGLLGGFYGHFIGILTPDIMATDHTVEVIALNIIGGRGTLWGPLVAAFLIIPAFESLKSLMEIRLIIYGVLLLLVIISYPAGLAGLVRTVWQRIQMRRRSS
jgi:branched-chain amino acid transport system permease protein